MSLYISQPDSGDQALEIAETMVRSGAMDIIDCGLCSSTGSESRRLKGIWVTAM